MCLAVETGEEPPDKRDGETVGIDMGIKTLATYSDGTTIDNPKELTASIASYDARTKPLRVLAMFRQDEQK